MPMDAGAVILAVERIASVSVVISSLEWLAQRRELADPGLMGWPLAGLRQRLLARPPLSRILPSILGYPNILAIVLLRLAAASFLLFGPAEATRARDLAIFTVAATSVAMTLRCPFGLDGADQMSTFTFGTLFLARLGGGTRLNLAFLWILALQACLSYFTAGVAKLFSPQWRSGTAIAGISATRIYGWKSLSGTIRSIPRASFLLGWSAIIVECAFPLALIGPRPVTLSLLAAGILFHATCALVMGLNTFFWSFVATYPAVYFCAARWQ